jgi:hypothetical protein
MSTPAAAASAEQVALTQQPPAADAAAVTDVQVDVTTTTEPAAAGAADKQAGGGGGILTSAAGTNQGAFGAVEWALFTSVGCIWGSSFLFMAIGLEAFEPGVITWLRVSSGALVLALVPRARAPIAREDWPRLLTLSLLWVAVPFTLFPIAQQVSKRPLFSRTFPFGTTIICQDRLRTNAMKTSETYGVSHMRSTSTRLSPECYAARSLSSPLPSR